MLKAPRAREFARGELIPSSPIISNGAKMHKYWVRFYFEFDILKLMIKKTATNASPAEMLREEMLTAALASRASDIHIDPLDNSILIRFRVDGDLTTWAERDAAEYDNLISHLKIMSAVDITRHGIPQEGHFVWASDTNDERGQGRILDIRSSFFPTIYGDAIVMRILNRSDTLIHLKNLGFSKSDFDSIKTLITKPFGMVLITGPVGSGKTTTVYSILNELASSNRNIITLEDPVEYFLPMVRQSKISPEHDYTFALGIRSVLRQDPDVIVVGEIRDFETAENAIRASLTGRLLLATLHANTAIGTITRLIDMKINHDLVAYSLTGVINQRLVRKICPDCREEYRPPQEILKSLGLSTADRIYHGRGCKSCKQSGFSGRVGIFGILTIDDEIKRMIINGASEPDINKIAVEKGYKSVREDGLTKIKNGITTPEEVIKASS